MSAFVRVGQFKARPEYIEELCTIYEREAIPKIRAAPGNVSAVLLQPHRPEDLFMVLTIWETREHAEAYDHSGMAAQMVDKIRHAFAGPPTLSTYDAHGL